ncbi:hypothetical protein [Hymenobacter guriensis]|uniref:Uncharacterized protein n=1 Tax=Hymenobacter guriensis TaxID=2793065 RepID=A0ABS0L037_9BACT|nr:hypothetical protein [Hymenobacter guriensis]MBG8553480.1 hypothetical protein [Hymenobacter guriensis]
MWPLDKLIGINNDYEAAENYPGFFLIGTYEIGEACAIEKATGAIYTLPFIGNVQEDAVFVGKSVDEQLVYLKEAW